MSAFFFGQVNHHNSDRKTKILSCSLSIGLDSSGLSSHDDALNRHAVLYSPRQMMISSTDTTSNSKSAFLRHTVWMLAHSLSWTFTHIWTLKPSPYMFTYCGSRPSFSFLQTSLPKREKSFFSFSNSLHSFLAARSIYSKYSETIPMASRDGLLHIVSPQKSPSVQEGGLNLVIQIIQGNLSEFSCLTNLNKDSSKVLRAEKQHSVALFCCPIYTSWGCSIWESFSFLYLMELQ